MVGGGGVWWACRVFREKGLETLKLGVERGGNWFTFLSGGFRGLFRVQEGKGRESHPALHSPFLVITAKVVCIASSYPHGVCEGSYP
jgi:hypothetical protein